MLAKGDLLGEPLTDAFYPGLISYKVESKAFLIQYHYSLLREVEQLCFGFKERL